MVSWYRPSGSSQVDLKYEIPGLFPIYLPDQRLPVKKAALCCLSLFETEDENKHSVLKRESEREKQRDGEIDKERESAGYKMKKSQPALLR